MSVDTVDRWNALQYSGPFDATNTTAHHTRPFGAPCVSRGVALACTALGGRSSLTVFGIYLGLRSVESAALVYPGYPMNQPWETGLAQQRKGRVMTITSTAAGSSL